MVDGNELEAAITAAKFVRECGKEVLYDAGGQYKGVERLLPHVDYLIPSKEFALGHTGCESVEDAAKKLFETYLPKVVVITCGKDGGVYFDGKEICSYPIYPAKVIDSNGAGDVFREFFISFRHEIDIFHREGATFDGDDRSAGEKFLKTFQIQSR